MSADLDQDRIIERLRGWRTRHTASALRGDYHLSANADPSRPEPAQLDLRPASVLMPLITRPQGITVLLTQRTDELPSHAGQVAFPGGRTHSEDEDAIATALRETEEEIGLPRRHVTVIGQLDTYATGTGYAITPVVGLVAPPFELKPDPREVADIFEVPLGFFLDPVNHELRSAYWQGRERHFYVMPYENRYIWGATAGMLKNLYHVLVDA